MREFIKSERYTDTSIHSAETWRVPVNASVVDSICGDLGWWLYDSNGNLIDRSGCDMYHIGNEESHYGVYFGRKDSEIRFNTRDIVEVRDIGNEKPYLGIINDAPLTIDEMWEVYEKRVKHWGPQKIKNFSNDFFPEDKYYNPNEETEIDRLTSLLDIDKFEEVQTRLKEEGMRTGFACIFYGDPEVNAGSAY